MFFCKKMYFFLFNRTETRQISSKEEKKCRFEEPPTKEKQVPIDKKIHVGKFKRLTYRGREWAEELKGMTTTTLILS